MAPRQPIIEGQFPAFREEQYARRRKLLSRGSRKRNTRRRERQRLNVARSHARGEQARHFALHALTTRLVKELDLIVLKT